LLTTPEQVQELKDNLKERKDFAELTRVLTAIEHNTPMDFYDLSVVFRYLQTKARRIRQYYMGKIIGLEIKCEEGAKVTSTGEKNYRKDLFEQVYKPRCANKPPRRRITFEEFNAFVEFRNKVYHKGFYFSNSECKLADKVFKCFDC